MKIKKTFQGELPENRIVNTYSNSLTDAYSANYLNDKLKSVEVSSTEPTNGKDIWVQMGKNLFNKYSKLISGKYLASDGAIGDDANLFYQETYIPVEPNTSYVISNENSENHRICEYDANKTFLTRFLNDNASLSCIFTSGPSTKFIRISCRIDNIDSLQIEQGEFKTDYEPYMFKKIYVKKDEKYELVYDEECTRKEVYIGPTEPKSGEEIWLQKGKNLFNKSSVDYTKWLSVEGEPYIANEGDIVTSFIDVIPNKKYTISGLIAEQWLIVCGYDVNKNFVSMIQSSTGSSGIAWTFEMPSNVSYIRCAFSRFNSSTTVIQIEESSTATNYEPFVRKIYTKNDNEVYEELINTSAINSLIPQTKVLTPNYEYLYEDFQYICVQIGNIVFLNIGVLALKQAVSNGELLVSGLPPSFGYVGALHGHCASAGSSIRCVINADGTLKVHWGGTTSVGDAANKQFAGTFIYKTTD